MAFGYAHGLIINSEGTAASVTMDVANSGASLMGSIMCNVQFFAQDGLKRYKFSSTNAVQVKALHWKSVPYVEALFKSVTLEDLINRTNVKGCTVFLSAARINSHIWHGSLSVKSADQLKLKLSGQFDGLVQVSEGTLNAQAISDLVSGYNEKALKVPVIIQLKKEHQLLTQSHQELGKFMGVSIRHRLPMIDSFSAKVTKEQLHSLLEHGAVKTVWRDRIHKMHLHVAKKVVRAPLIWQGGCKGKGVGIAIADTGVYPHPDLTVPNNRIIAFKDMVNKKTKPYDDQGHGTHVAGDAAGNGHKSGGLYRGPAPEANVIAIKVLNKNGAGTDSIIIAGIQWAIKHKKEYNIRVLNLSLGSAATTLPQYDPLCQVLEKAWQAGIAVCVSAGNSGPRPSSINTPGIDPLAITVGNDDDKRTVAISDDSVERTSSRGPALGSAVKPDVLAPGDNIISLRAPGSALDKALPKARVGQWYLALSGTSMAAPICSGVAALLIEKKPSMTPDQVKSALLAAARPLSNASANAQGKGVIDAAAAVKAGQSVFKR